MAHIHPTGWREMSITGTAAREIETLSYLDEQLADAPYSIYHGAHWTNVEQGFSAYGEIDFIIVAPNGRVLLIEQKSGFLSETPEGLVKSYQGKARKIRNQILRTIEGLVKRFGSELSIDYLLYCPDYTVRDPHLAGIDPRHIIDATAAGRLAHVIREVLPVSEFSDQFEKVTRFLGDTLSLRPDPSAMIGCATDMVTRLSGGLATWARRRDFTINPFPVLAAAVGTFVLALGPFASWAPFAIADRLGMLASFRVAPRWLFWTATALLLLVAAYRGRRYRTAITAALGLAATELFLTGMIALPKPYLLSAEQYRPPDAPFEQQWRYRINRNGRPGDENLYETTRNNYGQFIAANSLLFTIEDPFTKRCGLNQNCPFLSPNARLVSWSPNRIEIERTGPGPFLVNMNPGGGWLVNGRYAFSHLRSAEPADYFVVDDPAARIVLEYAPPLSPRWFEYKLKH